MKKYAIYFLIFIFLIGLLDVEQYILFLTDAISFLIILMYSLSILFRNDIEPKNIYKKDKEWIWIFCLALIYDINSFIKWLNIY